MKPVIVIGAGGHAKVVLDLLARLGRKVVGMTDTDASKHHSRVLGAVVLGDDGIIASWDSREVDLVNGIGFVKTAEKRRQAFEQFSTRGFSFPTLVHPSAVIATDVVLDQGVQVMAGAVIQTGTTVGANSIVNTRASVDHDCRIGAHVHVAPGATISGGVSVGAESLLGVGCTVIQQVQIGRCVIVGAGAVVIGSVAARRTVTGIPAREEAR